MSIHLITSLPDGRLSSTPWMTIATEMNDVWVTDRAVANTHCQSRTTAAQRDLANTRAHLDRYGTARKNEANTHCQNMETSGIANVNEYTDGKKSWVNQQLASRMKKP